MKKLPFALISRIPMALIYSRLLIGLLILVLSIVQAGHYSLLVIVLFSVGLLTDIFDGIIARRLGISTQRMRRMDSSVDQAFFICVALATYIQCTGFFKSNALRLAILIGTEGLTYLVSFFKFKKEVATHSIGAKIWTLFLFATLIQVILQCQSVILFGLCFWIGLVTRLEIIAIILILRKWTNDVPTFYHALKLRQGKEIKRNKLFNG